MSTAGNLEDLADRLQRHLQASVSGFRASCRSFVLYMPLRINLHTLLNIFGFDGLGFGVLLFMTILQVHGQNLELLNVISNGFLREFPGG